MTRGSQPTFLVAVRLPSFCSAPALVCTRMCISSSVDACYLACKIFFHFSLPYMQPFFLYGSSLYKSLSPGASKSRGSPGFHGEKRLPRLVRPQAELAERRLIYHPKAAGTLRWNAANHTETFVMKEGGRERGRKGERGRCVCVCTHTHTYTHTRRRRLTVY